MNIEIANRLVQFRKQNNLSQEQLAEKIGVSRQAISKWERSEASPDTDNLILLARLYNVSLDELLKTDDEIPVSEPETSQEKTEQTEQAEQAEQPDDNATYINEDDVEVKGEGNNATNSDKKKFGKGGIHIKDGEDVVHIGLDGIHVEDGEDVVHVGFDGIHVKEKNGDNVNVGPGGVFVNGKQMHGHGNNGDCDWNWNWKENGDEFHNDWQEWHGTSKANLLSTFPYTMLCIIGYLMIGFFANGWWWGWLLFLTIPLFHGTVKAIGYKKAGFFPYPILCAVAFLAVGLFFNLWTWAWLIFLTIPLYYGLISAIKHKSLNRFPYPVLAALAFLSVGIITDIWHPTWAIFLTIPLYYWLADAIKHK